MPHVLACVVEEHDIRLVLLAGVICSLASATAFNLVGRADWAQSPRDRWWWITGAAFVAGGGVWATHFVAMLAYEPGVPLEYGITRTILSVIIAIAIVGLGIVVALTGIRWAALGGAIAGAGVGAMHYTGMAALHAPAEIAFDGPTVVLSLAWGVGLGAGAFYARARWPDTRGRAAAVTMFALSILMLHFTAISAMTLTPAPGMAIPRQLASPQTLAVAVGAFTILIIALSLVGSIFDERLARRNLREADQLRQHVAELEGVQRQLQGTGATLANALDRAAASNRAKSQFLTTISHELRTPLNAVIGFSELIQMEIHGPIGDPRYTEYVSNIHESGAHLLALINDVLDFAKIDVGRVPLADEEIEIPDLFTETLRLARGSASSGIELLQDPQEPDLPRLRGDRRRIKQIMLNLLSNAIKFTPPPGTVTVAAKRHGRELTIAVSDTGIGIAAGDIGKALEPFGQVDGRLARDYEGAGLGLPLCKQLVELHGGSLRIDSVPHRGTTVTLTFPADRSLPLLKP
ncbi:MAG TPA: ATP-binding protein, partial [Stellaceae bacterium]|nr:ATP-binding protein [Stellaceae bacterium]